MRVAAGWQFRTVRQSAWHSVILSDTFDSCRELESDQQCRKAKSAPLRASYPKQTTNKQTNRLSLRATFHKQSLFFYSQLGPSRSGFYTGICL